MKKYISVLFLLVFIIPSIAFASWWNPFSWKIFHKKEVVPQTQIINNPVVEPVSSAQEIEKLQKQLDDLKKKQTDFKNTTNIKTPVVNNKPTVSKTDTTIKENLNEIPLSMLVSVFNSIYSSIDYIEKVIPVLNTIIEDTTARKDLLKSKNIYDDKGFNLLIELDENNIEFYKTTMTNLKSMLNTEKNTLSGLQIIKDKIKNKTYENREAALKEVDEINKVFDKQSEFSDSISKVSQDMTKIYTEGESTYRKMLDMYISYLEANKPSPSFYIPTTYHQPIVIPQIQIPKTTYCSMRGGINGYDISCY